MYFVESELPLRIVDKRKMVCECGYFAQEEAITQLDIPTEIFVGPRPTYMKFLDGSRLLIKKKSRD